MWKNKAVNTDASAEFDEEQKNERKRNRHTHTHTGVVGGELAGGQLGRHTHTSLLINYHRGWRGLRSHRCVFSSWTPPCQPPDPSGAVPWRCPPCQPVFSRAVNKEIDYQAVRKWQLDRGRSPWVTEGTIGSLQQQRRATRTVPTRGGKPAAGTATAFWSSSSTAAKHTSAARVRVRLCHELLSAWLTSSSHIHTALRPRLLFLETHQHLGQRSKSYAGKLLPSELLTFSRSVIWLDDLWWCGTLAQCTKMSLSRVFFFFLIAKPHPEKQASPFSFALKLRHYIASKCPLSISNQVTARPTVLKPILRSIGFNMFMRSFYINYTPDSWEANSQLSRIHACSVSSQSKAALRSNYNHLLTHQRKLLTFLTVATHFHCHFSFTLFL